MKSVIFFQTGGMVPRGAAARDRRSRLYGMIGLAAVVTLGGCFPSGTAPTVKATGKVLYHGKPLAGVGVTFTPEEGRPAVGVTDPSGRFTLSTFRPNDGAVPGHHNVSLAEGAASPPPPMPGTMEAAKAPPRMPEFPAKYSSPDTSGFTAEVKSGQANDFTFELAD